MQRIEQSVKTETLAANRRETFEQSALAKKKNCSNRPNHSKNSTTSPQRSIATAFSDSNNANALASRTEIKDASAALRKTKRKALPDSTAYKDNFYALLNKPSRQNTDQQQQSKCDKPLNKKVTAMQQNNEQKLEQVRITVDEKLRRRWKKDSGKVFNVSERPRSRAQRGLGDMQQLATSVNSDPQKRTQQC